MLTKDNAGKSDQNHSASKDNQSPALRWAQVAISVIGILMIAYHIFSTWFPIFSPILHQNIHLSFAFTLIFLAAMVRSKSRFRLFYLTGIVISLAVTLYIHVNVERLDMWAGFPEKVDVIVGLVLVISVVFLTWKIWGSVFPILLGISVLYALFGHHISGALSQSGKSTGAITNRSRRIMNPTSQSIMFLICFLTLLVLACMSVTHWDILLQTSMPGI